MSASQCRRLARVEGRAGRSWRRSLAKFFSTDGDPRLNSEWNELSAVEQTRLGWLYDAWRCTPSGFMRGVLPSYLAPEPPPAPRRFPPRAPANE